MLLWGAQQQLAKLQLQLEQLHDSVAVVTRGREEADQGLIDITAKSDALLHAYLDRTQKTVKIGRFSKIKKIGHFTTAVRQRFWILGNLVYV